MHGKTPVRSFKSSPIPKGKLGPVTRRQYIEELIDHMWDVHWFDNLHTHGCYTESDWEDDLTHMEMSELKALRKYQIEKLDADLFYEHIWTGETIVYREFS